MVKALDGVDFDLVEGETLGLVGETGCGKSVTALSILRLIPQPPGKIEEGEALFDVPSDAVARIEALESQVRQALPRIFGNREESFPPDLSARRLRALWAAALRAAPKGSPDLEALRAASVPLLQLKQQYDLFLKSEEEMRAIRGNKIAMIFQEPMQALNPVFPIGDQISENILLHQRPAVVKGLVDKMELEAERDRLAKHLRSMDPHGTAAPGRAPTVPPPRSPWVVLCGLLWAGLSALTLGLYALALTTPGALPYPGTYSGLLFGLGLAVFAVPVAVALLQKMEPRTRTLGIAVASLEILSRVTLLVFPFGTVFRLFLLFSFLGDLGIVYFLTRPTTGDRFKGRAIGLEAALLQAEGDPEDLIDLRDAVAAARAPDAQREAAMTAVERLVATANRLLGVDEPITGHLHAGLPRRLQIAFFRRLRDSPRHPVVRVLQWLPVVRRPFTRPLQDEGVRWAVAMLRKVKISDPVRIAGQYPYELSGGMQQRALIAIALSCNPRLLIADEPTTALDVTIQAQILELIRGLKTAFGSTVLLITHDLGIIAEMCNRVCVMYAGIIAEDAPVRTVFKAPLHPYTQGLMKAVPSHTVRKEELEIIRGSVPNLIKPPTGCRFHPRCPMVMPQCKVRRPPVFEPEPGHKVTCLLYEGPLQETVAGGGTGG